MLLVLTMVLCCFAGCGTKGKTLEDIKEAGKLVIATSPDFPPFESLEGNKVVGIEVEILEKFAEEIGVELEIKQMDFDSVLPGVQTGKFTVGVSGISVTPAREKNTLFTDPYCLAAQAIVVTSDSAIASKADLEGKTVSVQTGTTAESGCQDEGIEVQAFAANADAKAALTTGKVDAWVVDNLTALQMVEDGEGLVILNEKLTAEEREKIKQKIVDAELALNDEIIASNEEAAERTREEWEKISEIFADFASQADDMVAGLGSVFDGIFNIFKEIADGGKISVENILQSVSAIAQGVNEIVGGMYERQIEDLEKQEEANETAKDKEIARIEELAETGAISEEEAEARKRAAEDKTAKKNEEIARKKAALQTKQAKLEKAANIISTIMNTAVAVMKAWSQGGIFAAPMAAMIAAMGAVQLATIVAQPIPKYAKGTKDHKGGLAWVGDGGVSETIITNKGMYLTPDTPTLVDLPKGAKVIPYALDMERMKARANDLEGLMAYRQENELPPITIENDYSGLQRDIKKLEESQRRGFKELSKAIKNQDYKRFAASI